MTTGIAQLQQPHIDDVERRAGDSARSLTRSSHGDGLRQPPIGDVDAHSTWMSLMSCRNCIVSSLFLP